MTIQSQTQRYKDAVDTAIEQALSSTGLPQQAVIDAMRYSLEAGGKRIRPILTLAFCEACGGDITAATPFAAAVEMIHCYSLIHDDLPCMDNDDMRRGKPSCHIAFGESTALLAGDGLLTEAFAMIARSPKEYGTDPAAALEAAEVLSRRAGIYGMIGGQVIDLSLENGAAATPELLSKMDEYKTSALIQAACEMGVIAAGAGEEKRAVAAEYGLHLGLAFQIIDDILDVTADEQALGKPVGSDKDSNKTTYVSVYGLERARILAEESTARALGALAEFDSPPFLTSLTNQLLNRSY